MTDHRCPDCGEPMTMERAPCPDGKDGCLVLHKRAVCVPCRRKQWEEHDRPATIGELKDLSRKIDELARVLNQMKEP